MKKIGLCLMFALLGACSLGVRKDQPISIAVYDFGLPASRISQSNDLSSLNLDVKAVPRLNSTRINYRLIYSDALKTSDYSTSNWADNPATLIAQSLEQQLGVVGGFSLNCQLRVDLQEFSHVFDSPDESRALLLATVSILDIQKKILARESFKINEPAVTPNAEGGVRALVGASRKLGGELDNWLFSQIKAGRLKGCRT